MDYIYSGWTLSDTEKKNLESLLENIFNNNKNNIFYYPPGKGKTSFVIPGIVLKKIQEMKQMKGMYDIMIIVST